MAFLLTASLIYDFIDFSSTADVVVLHRRRSRRRCDINMHSKLSMFVIIIIASTCFSRSLLLVFAIKIGARHFCCMHILALCMKINNFFFCIVGTCT